MLFYKNELLAEEIKQNYDTFDYNVSSLMKKKHVSIKRNIKSAFYKSAFYKSAFYKSAFYKSAFYKSAFYKSAFYKSAFYKSAFYKSSFYKSAFCKSSPVQSSPRNTVCPQNLFVKYSEYQYASKCAKKPAAR